MTEKTKSTATATSGNDNNVSKTTISIAGLAVDIYGLSELKPGMTDISCLWLHHGRTRRKEDMADVARMVVAGFHHEDQHNRHSSSSSRRNSKSQQEKQQQRGLIAVAFDQRNHGTRLADKVANATWRSGNARHAQDMFATVTGTVMDTIHLMDVLEGYLWLEDHDNGDGDGEKKGEEKEEKKKKKKKVIDQHLVLGVSLGGHCAWQLLFGEPRVTAGVVVIGCPDYMRLMSTRAKNSKLSTYQAHDNGASFLGSKDFPPGLVSAAKKWDPKARLFGTGPIPPPYASSSVSGSGSTAGSDCVGTFLDETVCGKRIQVLSGGQDKLVPYAAAKPFLDLFKDAVSRRYNHNGDNGQTGSNEGEGVDKKGVYLEDNVYPEAGHEFSDEMKKDALRFVLDSVALAAGGNDGEEGVSGRELLASPKI